MNKINDLTTKTGSKEISQMSKWQPIETAPVGEDHGGPFDIGFTHWMPLPTPPKNKP